MEILVSYIIFDGSIRLMVFCPFTLFREAHAQIDWKVLGDEALLSNFSSPLLKYPSGRSSLNVSLCWQ